MRRLRNLPFSWLATLAIAMVMVCASVAAAATGSLSVTLTVPNQAPTAPVLVTPADAYTSSTATVTLTATHSDADGDTGQLEFEICSVAATPVQACSAAGGSVLGTGNSAAGIASGANGSWLSSGLANGTQYWRARSTDGAVTGAWTAMRTITVSVGSPPTTVLATPANASTVGTAPQLRASYDDPDGDPGELVFEVCSAATCSPGELLASGTAASLADGEDGTWQVDPPLAPSTTYYWRATPRSTAPVQAGTPQGRSFSTDARPTLTDVAVNGATVVAVGTGGRVWISSNGGGAWASQLMAGAPALTAVANSGTTFVAVGRGGVAFRSTNAGVAWTPLSTGTAQHLLDVDFASASELWLVGAGGTALRSTDGGTTFAAQASNTGADITTIEAGSTWAVAGTATGRLLRWTGSTWVLLPSLLASGAGITGVVSPSTSAATWLTSNGTLLTTLDGGSTVTLDGSVGFGSALALDDDGAGGSRTWAVGAAGAGANLNVAWNPFTAGTGALYGIAASSNAVAYAVGADNTVYSLSASGATATPVLAPPTNTVAPAVTGTPSIGQVLTAGTGTWDSPGSSQSQTYQWQRCDAAGNACSDLGGATAATYTVVVGDVGSTLRAVVTTTNAAGTATQTTAAQGPIAAANTAPGAPTSLSPADGATVTAASATLGATYADADADTGQLAFEVCTQAPTTAQTCVDAGGTVAASGSSAAALASGSAGNAVLALGNGSYHWRVRATDTPGLSGTWSATRALTVSFVAPTNSLAPAVTGDTEPGESLSADPGTWTASPAPAYAYAWQRCNTSGAACAAIAGATAASYVATAADVDRTLRVEVTATNDAGSSASWSAATAPVNSDPVAPASLQPADGSTSAAATVELRAAYSDPDGHSGQLRFEVCSRAVSAGQSCTGAGSGTVVATGTSASGLASGSTGTWSSAGLANGTYHWRAQATDLRGAQGTWTATRAITVSMVGPANDSAPVISGTPAPGEVLTGATGAWSGSPAVFTYTYAWQRCDVAGADCVPIAGATAASYSLTTEDVGSTVRLAVTATNTVGSGKVTSQPLGPVADPTPAPAPPAPPVAPAPPTAPDAPAPAPAPRADTGIVGIVGMQRGTARADALDGSDESDEIYGEDGDDLIRAGGGKDDVDGGAGVDVIYGGDGDDRLLGCIGDDTIFGGAGNDHIFGCVGNDRLMGDAGSDSMTGATGNDTMNGGDGADRLGGDAGNDTIKGGAGNDVIVGGAGVDRLDGGLGNDRINAVETHKRLTYTRAPSWLPGAELLDTLLERTEGDDATFAKRGPKKPKPDVIRCGKGVDRVKIDQGDKVAKDCEQVTVYGRRFFR